MGIPTNRPPVNETRSTMDIMQLAAELCPGCGMSMADVPVEDEATYNEVLSWDESNPHPKPTWAEIVAQAAVTAQYVVDTEYQVARRAAYASIGDQQDMQYKDALNGTTTWVDHIAAVKAANPKEPT
ncbi:MAG: hypothetical protein HOE83_08445 [Alphaproteobacteria bacterium]|jgi:hypothetical protein|nr:hypothetical protein [Alphaproteobacteria bacterium]